MNSPSSNFSAIAERPQFKPVFVHASPRSGSTYFFNVLRRNESLLCFNEAINNGFKGDQKGGKARYRLFDMPRFSKQRVNLNHHFLDRADFEEFIDARDAVMHLFPKFQVFENYIPKQGLLQAELASYLSGLIDYIQAQQKRPVLCEIYSRGRAGALRHMFGGFHIAGYRDPLSQIRFFDLASDRTGVLVLSGFPGTGSWVSQESIRYIKWCRNSGVLRFCPGMRRFTRRAGLPMLIT